MSNETKFQVGELVELKSNSISESASYWCVRVPKGRAMSEQMKIVLFLPYPPKELNPNKRMHWAKKTPIASAYKKTCWALALEAGWKNLSLKDGKRVHLWINFYPPDRRHRDDDNTAAAFKSGRDGIALALRIDDKKFVSHPFLADYTPDFSGVKVRFSLGIGIT